ncbi:hypothetical protein [Azospirillum sp. TSA6c]|uniref:hypothetical protein n=1 Tax=Azospirillum sp. TSA6c TaxID=709813 RepID=UPI0011B82516|nr:hypothetical protein [Azospirillum sp. TSA6c]
MAELIRFPWEPELQDARDLTPFVARIEKLEDLCGIRIGGISAHLDSVTADGLHFVKMMAEVTGLAGLGQVLDASVTVQCVAYDAAGRIVGVADEMLWQSGFRGMHALSVNLFCQAKPERFVIFPRK